MPKGNRSLPIRHFVLALALLAQSAAAQSVDLILPPGQDDVRDLLESVSLTIGLPDDSPAQDIVAAARADYRKLLTGLYAQGHFGGTISITLDGAEASAIQPLDAPDRVARVQIIVIPGPRFTFGDLAIAPLAPDTDLPPAFAPGGPAGTEAVRGAVAAAITGWRAAGHARAAAGDQNIRARHNADMLDVAVSISPGPLLRFGPLTIIGNQAVRTARIAQIAGLPTGQVFDPAALDLAATRLRRTGAFQSVSLTEFDGPLPDDLLPITAQVAELPPRRIGFGAEVSSVDGVTVSAFWLHRNLLGGAERFRVEGEITGIGSQFVTDGDGPDITLGVSFGRPATFGPDADLTLAATAERLDQPDYTLTQIGATAGLIRYSTPQLTYELGIGLLTAREETAFRTRDYTLLTLPLRGTLDRRNDPFNPDGGYFLDLQLTPFAGLVNSDSGARLYGDARIYRSLGQRLTLAARAQVGSVIGAGLLDAPTDFRFYSGGGGTVRGQPFQSLGVQVLDDFGTGPQQVDIGGASFLGAQFEARVQVTDRIGAVAFYDIGVIGIDSLPDADSDWHAGAGIGVRYDTPIGPIRLDLATPASGDDAGERLEVYIGIGQSF